MEKQPRRIDENQHPVRSNSYILRIWRADEPWASEWHASLEDPSTKERFGFSSLEQLFVFLMELSEGDSSMSGGISNMGKGGG